MKKTNKKRNKKQSIKKEIDIRPVEIKIDEVKNITLHFKERWNERVSEISIKNFNEVFSRKFENEKFENIDGDYYKIGDIMVVMGFRDGGPALVTCIGNIEDNYMMYDLIESRGARYYNNFMRRYGKLHIETVA